jgi:two-component system sensor histidine kinase SenX3
MTVAVAALVAAAAVAVAVLVTRAMVGRRVGALARRLDPGQPDIAHQRLDASLQAIERVAARLEADAEAQAARLHRLQVAVDALPLGFVVVDHDERVLLRNARAEHFLGVRYADALVEEAVRTNLRAALAGEPSTQTLDLHGPPRRIVVVRSLPVEESEAGVAIALIEDVSERSRLEAMRTDFVSNISHELRTPVGALVLLAETLEDEDEPALMSRLVQKMVAESTRVARIVEDLLELSRLEQDGRPRPEVVAVGSLASEAADRVRDLAAQRDIDIVVAETSRRVPVVGDRRQLVSAIANLIENGVKYSDPGEIVEVSASVEDAGVNIVVTDHGIGIPARDKDRIFERFYRVDRARSRDTGGTGLGLAIVRHVATNHGGTVSVESAEGAGSTFTIRIPSGPKAVPLTMPEAG